jgi:hypothetical protein
MITETRSVTYLVSARTDLSVASALGRYLIFAGGRQENGTILDTVEIYDVCAFPTTISKNKKKATIE